MWLVVVKYGSEECGGKRGGGWSQKVFIKTRKKVTTGMPS